MKYYSNENIRDLLLHAFLGGISEESIYCSLSEMGRRVKPFPHCWLIVCCSVTYRSCHCGTVKPVFIIDASVQWWLNDIIRCCKSLLRKWSMRILVITENELERQGTKTLGFHRIHRLYFDENINVL